MRTDNQIDTDTFLNWVVDRYKAYKKGIEMGYTNRFGCPKCSTGSMTFDEKNEVYFCSKSGCLTGSIKSLVGH